MTAQFLRHVQLSVQTRFQLLDLSDLHFKFHTTQFTLETPQACQVRIYNLKDSTAQLIQSEGAEVVLSAGYGTRDEDIGTIFKGPLVQVRRGRETPADTYMDLTASDDVAKVWGAVYLTLDAGSTFFDRVVALASAWGVTLGAPLPDSVPESVLPRGRVFAGSPSDIMRDMAFEAECSWLIKGGQLVVVPYNGYLGPDEGVELTSDSGLIGFPEQTEDGITVRCLLNPQLSIHELVRIKNADIRQMALPLGHSLGDLTRAATMAQIGNDVGVSTSDDGLYKIIVLEHTGDTRGNEYYSDMTCLSITQQRLPTSYPSKGYNAGGPGA